MLVKVPTNSKFGKESQILVGIKAGHLLEQRLKFDLKVADISNNNYVIFSTETSLNQLFL